MRTRHPAHGAPLQDDERAREHQDERGQQRQLPHDAAKRLVLEGLLRAELGRDDEDPPHGRDERHEQERVPA